MQTTTMPVPPRVSIVIPCFNAARWVSASLDSALAQTYENVEIIAIDDGSTDETPTILAHYREKHGIRVLTQPNRGPSVANNAGFAESTGDYIKFFDSDDLLSPDAVSSQVTALAAHPGRLAYGAWGRFQGDPLTTRFTPHPGWHDSDSPVDWLCETWADTEIGRASCRERV